MKTIMARTSYETSFTKRYFQLKKKHEEEEEEDEEEEKALYSFSSSLPCEEEDNNSVVVKKKKKLLRFRSVFGKHTSRFVCTLFGHRNGHINFAFQEDPKSYYNAFFIELPTPTSSLIREMASGLVRIVLECDKLEKKGVKLLEESLWRTYCNGKKCGIAIRQEVGDEEMKVLKAVGPVSVGAGVLPGNGGSDKGELMYMRARFERVIGSRHSEAFYMLNPDGTGGTELSVFLFRV